MGAQEGLRSVLRPGLSILAPGTGCLSHGRPSREKTLSRNSPTRKSDQGNVEEALATTQGSSRDRYKQRFASLPPMSWEFGCDLV